MPTHDWLRWPQSRRDRRGAGFCPLRREPGAGEPFTNPGQICRRFAYHFQAISEGGFPVHRQMNCERVKHVAHVYPRGHRSVFGSKRCEPYEPYRGCTPGTASAGRARAKAKPGNELRAVSLEKERVVRPGGPGGTGPARRITKLGLASYTGTRL